MNAAWRFISGISGAVHSDTATVRIRQPRRSGCSPSTFALAPATVLASLACYGPTPARGSCHDWVRRTHTPPTKRPYLGGLDHVLMDTRSALGFGS